MSEKELMKVVGFYEGLPIDDPKSFIDEKRTDTCTQFTGSSGKSQRSIC
jgi:hypothetical protein